uniref:peptidylprolyl isomerase n=1 Tax=Globisporangium ultimum (strain ATCC 200006 / CBS 805.95 / DAOM BR144) TaxID=431595 RepID=K3WN40_GLOUD
MVAISPEERADFDDLLGSGGIFRKMLRTNPDGAQAEFGEEITIRYSEHLLEGDVTVSQDQTRKIRIGDGEVMPALELVGKMMRVGEACEVRCDARFAYGDVGLEPKVLPGAAMKLFIELLRVGKKITAEMTSQELIEEANKKKESGNRYFKEKNYEQAAKLYKRALKLLETWEHSEEDAQACKDLLIALGNNVGNVQFRLKQYKEARDSSLEVLQLDPRNVKAMYRVGQIGLEQNDFTEALEFLQKATVIEPKNVKVRQLIKDLKKKKQQVKQEQKKLYSKLGGKSASSDAGVTQPNVLVRAFKSNPSLAGAIVSVIIALLIYQFIGKRFHGMD